MPTPLYLLMAIVAMVAGLLIPVTGAASQSAVIAASSVSRDIPRDDDSGGDDSGSDDSSSDDSGD